jgi:PAS domain-containing protein
MQPESGLLYIEASGDGQIEKIMGDTAWLPVTLKAHETSVSDVFPALASANGIGRLDLDFVEITPEVYADIQYQSHDGRLYVWLRNMSRHAAHLRAAQQVANSRALKETIAARWMDDIRRESSHLRMVLNALPMPVGYWSRNGELLFGNERFRELRNSAAGGQGMTVPAEVWAQAIALPGLGSITFVRTDLTNQPLCKLVADVSPAGEITGLIDITEIVVAH